MRFDLQKRRKPCKPLKITFAFQAVCFLFSTILLSVSCSAPNLEKQECIEARETVKQFYSMHFGTEIKPSADNVKKREPFLTGRLFEELNSQTDTARDYFTQTDDYPRAFRVGGCEAVSDNKTVFEVLLFWKDDTSADQKEISVETVKIGDKWLIDRIESKP